MHYEKPNVTWPSLRSRVHERRNERVRQMLMKPTLALLILPAVLLATAPHAPTSVVVDPPQRQLANPFAIAFGNTTNTHLYAKPGALVVAGRCVSHYTTPAMQAVRAGGGEVLQYIIPSEVNDSLQYCSYGRDQEYYTGYGEPVPLWPYPKSAPGTRRKWPGTKITDMRPGSPWIVYTVRYIEGLMTSGKVDGVFLDTVGAQSYGKLADWSAWSKEEKDAYTAGNVDLVRRLDASRARLNPGFILVSNSIWTRPDGDRAGLAGEQYVNGICIEHHPSGSAFHRELAGRPYGNPEKRRLLVIASCPAGVACDLDEEARKWARVPGVTHVSAQTGEQYKQALKPPIPAAGSLPPR